jgi:hypothetical protein
MRFTARWLAWLCLSLMLWTAAAESTHNHPSQTESASCSICAVAHSASPVALSDQARPIFTTVGMLQEKEVIAKARISVLDLGIRGPPAI